MFDAKYLDWNQKRIKGIIDFYGHKFMYYKKVLDLGCGYADISGVLYRLGADVTALDARQEHLQIVSKKFPGVKTVKADLDRNWPFVGKQFDLILDLDLICHLNNFETHLRSVCASTTHLVLESSICDSNDANKCISVPENKGIYDLSVNGIGCRPSAAAIERVLKDCGMNFRRLDSNKFNSGSYNYDWISKDNQESNINKRRIWFAVKQSSAFQFASPTENVSIPNLITTNVPVLQNTQIPAHNPKILHIQSGESNNTTIISSPPVPTNTSNYPKIAICISGHLRTFEKTYKSFVDNILMGNQDKHDVFIHTWETLGSRGSKMGSDENIVNLKTDKKLSEINSIIKPKALDIENYGVYSGLLAEMNNNAKLTDQDRGYLHNKNLISYASMLYSMNQSRKMLEKYENDNNIKYDIIIRLRTDLFFTEKFNISNIPMNVLHVPQIGKYYNEGMNDQFAVGSNRLVKVYLGLFDNLLGYINNRECLIRPEVFLRYHLKKNGISIQEDSIKFNIIRPDNRITTQTSTGQYWTNK